MKFLLNGGRYEFMYLKSPHILNQFKNSDIKNLIILPFTISNEDRFLLQDLSKDINLKNLNITHIHLDLDITTNLNRLYDADAIYFTGGNPLLLLNKIKELKIDKILNEIIEKKTLKLIGGSSAGAMILGQRVIHIHEDNIIYTIDGLNIIKNHLIFPHLNKINRKDHFIKILKDNHFKGIGIEEETEVFMDENYKVLDVYGKGNAILIIDQAIELFNQHL